MAEAEHRVEENYSLHGSQRAERWRGRAREGPQFPAFSSQASPLQQVSYKSSYFSHLPGVPCEYMSCGGHWETARNNCLQLGLRDFPGISSFPCSFREDPKASSHACFLNLYFSNIRWLRPCHQSAVEIVEYENQMIVPLFCCYLLTDTYPCVCCSNKNYSSLYLNVSFIVIQWLT